MRACQAQLDMPLHVAALTLVFLWVLCGCRLPAVFIEQNISLTEVMVRAQRVWGAPGGNVVGVWFPSTSNAA